MNGDSTSNIEDIVRRNVAALRSKANLTQQGLADEMLLRGIAWTRETVAQVETTNRRLGFTEAIAVAASLDVPLARLTATSADTVGVGESEWTAAYLGAAVAGTTGDVFPTESYSSSRTRRPAEPSLRREGDLGPEAVSDRRRGPRERRSGGTPMEPAPAQQKTAERIERRLRLRVTAGDVDSTAHHLWSRSLESEKERRAKDRHAVTGGSLKTIRGHVARDLDRELADAMEEQSVRAAPPRSDPMNADEAAWEATRLNIILANKGYDDSDVTRWWNFTRHRELDDRTIAEAWDAGRYSEVSRLVQSLPDRRALDDDR